MKKILTKMINGEDVTSLPAEECKSEGYMDIVDLHCDFLGLCRYLEDEEEWKIYRQKLRSSSKSKRKSIPKPKRKSLSNEWVLKTFITLAYFYRCLEILERQGSTQQLKNLSNGMSNC